MNKAKSIIDLQQQFAIMGDPFNEDESIELEKWMIFLDYMRTQFPRIHQENIRRVTQNQSRGSLHRDHIPPWTHYLCIETINLGTDLGLRSPGEMSMPAFGKILQTIRDSAKDWEEHN